MTPSSRTSVASVKFLISQNPKILTYLIPGNIGLISPPPYIFLAMTWEPASPKPIAKSPPIFVIVLSRMIVSFKLSFFLF
tara:strand:- start:1780 stop:2019 length:240 start_codon:yes stop_codon:yes gene_type:complete